MSEPGPVEHMEQERCAELAPVLAHDAHKYSRGMLAVVGGCEEYPAAPVMAARAAARAGAGYVRLFAPRPAAQIARAHLLSIPVTAVTSTACGAFDPEGAQRVVADAHKAQAFAIGPGLGRSSFAGEFLARLLGALHDAGDTRPILFDADALNVLAEHPELADLREGCADVLTPHAGEAARLLGRKVTARLDDARELASRYGSTVVLKGPDTLVAAADGSALLCDEGGPELAKAGTGDVLAGIISSLMAQGLGSFDACCLGVFVHGRAGKLAAAESGPRAVMPEDIIECIGPAFVSMGV